MITLDERNPDADERQRLAEHRQSIKTRVAMPGIIESFDADAQTVTVRCATRELLNLDGDQSWVDIPPLVDVPIVFPRAGGYVLTMPIKPGDECLVVFADNCIDGWWQSGGVQNQIDFRRHDLSDAIAIPGMWSQPRVLPNYSTDSAQLRTEDGSAYIELKGGTINIVGSAVNIRAGGATVIEGKNFLAHTHGGVDSGPSNTGGVS